MSRKIVIIGERNLAHRAHQGIEQSLALFQRDVDPTLSQAWVGTAAITTNRSTWS